MGKLIYDERFKTTEAQHEWIGSHGLPRHVVIRLCIEEQMLRQREFNRNLFCRDSQGVRGNEGISGSAGEFEGKPGPRAVETWNGVERRRERKRA